MNWWLSNAWAANWWKPDDWFGAGGGGAASGDFEYRTYAIRVGRR
jgi:hypothetical protein